LGAIFKGATPYFVLILVASLMVLTMPWLATWLPKVML
jgi:C4-dicarboxylate transporter, DctM subunit